MDDDKDLQIQMAKADGELSFEVISADVSFDLMDI